MHSSLRIGKNVKTVVILTLISLFVVTFYISNDLAFRHGSWSSLSSSSSSPSKARESPFSILNLFGFPIRLSGDSHRSDLSNLFTMPSFAESNLSCNLPLYISPNDLATKAYMKKMVLKCPLAVPDIVQVNVSGYLHRSAAYNSWQCFYSFITRKPFDQTNNYTPVKPLPPSGIQIPDSSPFVNVSCSQAGRSGGGQVQVKRSAYSHIPKFDAPQTDGPSVMIVVIESLSRLSYYRYLPRTMKALDELGDFQLLEGLTKVGRNSFPNSFGLLVGLAMQDEDCQKVKGPWDGKFDYIWDRFKSKGYVTGFVEDMAQGGLFTYYSKGFERPPTDWYPTPFWVNMYPQPGYYAKNWYNIWNEVKNYCFEERGTKLDIFLEDNLKFHNSVTTRNQSYFLYSFYSQSTHNLISSYQYVDSPLERFVRKLKSKLSNTIFILMGDHGQMHGPYSETTLGHFEGSLPFFGIRVPDTLNAKHPHLRQFLANNRVKLTSWFDVRTLLLDVLHSNYTKVDNESDPNSYTTTTNNNGSDTSSGQLSPWRQNVPNTRVCSEARIPDQWCVCNGVSGPKPFNEKYYRSLADRAIKNLNQILLIRCGTSLFLKSIKRVNQVLPHQSEEIGLKEQLRLILELRKVSSSVSDLELVLIRTRASVNGRWSEWKVVHRNYDVAIEQLCHLNKSPVKHIFL